MSRQEFFRSSSSHSTQLATRLFLAFTAPWVVSTALAQTPQTITVIGTAPLPGADQSLSSLPSSAQLASERDIRASGALDMADFLARRLSGVHVNDMAGNGIALDVNFRGYSASPILGTPQGLSVYLDGVRQNQAFGDIVQWELIPRGAVSRIALMPGANPVFGLNSLGGALVMETKSGLRHKGTGYEIGLGSHKQQRLSIEHGGSNERLDWYGLLSQSKDGGWRQSSQIKQTQVFGKLGWRDARSRLSLSLAHSSASLNGNGLQEQRLVEADRTSVYTRPDTSENRGTQLNLTAQHEVSSSLQWSGNAWWRSSRSNTLNGDVNEGSLDQNVLMNAADRTYLRNLPGNPYGLSATYTETASNTAFPYLRCIAQAMQFDEPGEKCNALIHRSQTQQTNYGIATQLASSAPLAGKANQFVVGASLDKNRVRYERSTQLAYLNPDRSVTGIPYYADGVSGGDINGAPFDERVNLQSRGSNFGVYALNTLKISKELSITASARYNQAKVSTQDAITPVGAGSLTADHNFKRLNPALGMNFSPAANWQIYLGYSEANRAPSAIELGCADPATPCRLPNAMAGDPPLKQVVTKAWELGARGKGLGAWSQLNWSASTFLSTNHDDILFVSSSTSGLGYFKNFGQTRRSGIELALSRNSSAVDWGASYTLLHATYQSLETVNANGNSSNSAVAAGTPGLGGTVDIRPGDRIPLTPKHQFKAHALWRFTPAWSVALEWQAYSSSLMRGNENNQASANAAHYLGSGRLAGYSLLHAKLNYKSSDKSTWGLNIFNLLNKRYATAGQLGATAFTASGSFRARPYPVAGADYPQQYSGFYSPGAPRSFYLSYKHDL